MLPESNTPSVALPTAQTLLKQVRERRALVDLSSLPLAYNPLSALEVFFGDPLLSQVARVTFLYYTGVWALVSTLMIYLVTRFHFSKVGRVWRTATWSPAASPCRGTRGF